MVNNKTDSKELKFLLMMIKSNSKILQEGSPIQNIKKPLLGILILYFVAEGELTQFHFYDNTTY